MMIRQQWRKQGTSSICLLCRHSFVRGQELRPQRLQHLPTSLRSISLNSTPAELRGDSSGLRGRARRDLYAYIRLRQIHSSDKPPSKNESPDSQPKRPQIPSNQTWSLEGQASWGGGWGAASSRAGPNLHKSPDGDGGLLPHEKLARDRARMKLSAEKPREGNGRAKGLNGTPAALPSAKESKRLHKGSEERGRTVRRVNSVPTFPREKASSRGPGHHSPTSLDPMRSKSQTQSHLLRRREENVQEFEQNRARWRNEGSRNNFPVNSSEMFNGQTNQPSRDTSQPSTTSISGSSHAAGSGTQEWGQLNRRNRTESLGWNDRYNKLRPQRPDWRGIELRGENKFKHQPGSYDPGNDAFSSLLEDSSVGPETASHVRPNIDRGRGRIDTGTVAPQEEDQGLNTNTSAVAAPPPSWNTDVRSRGRDRVEKPKKKARVQRRNSNMGYEDDEDDAAWLRAEERRRWKEERQAEKERELAAAGPTPILLPEFISVSNLAGALGVKSEQFIEQLGELGFENINYDSIMTGETAALVAGEYGFEPTVDTGASVDLKPRPPPSDPSSLPSRPPIVTIMGHVDHGKTTMLDWLRKSSVAAQEHGGITQHIGAFSVKLSTGKQITFLDTPGHAAFLTMRQRGANVTDIVILVVAADDSVKPQTLEALKHARAAKVPIIVAINKVDKDEARIDQVKADLARHGVEIEDFGGDVQVVCVSGKTGQGMNDLEENILTLSEIIDMRAETDGMAEGWILEASVKPIGKVATVLVKRGTLRRGDFIVAGTTWAKIKVLRNEAGAEILEAPPGTAVEILGWKDPPAAGDEVLQAPDESKAKAATHYREEIREREKAVATKVAQEQQEREKAEKEALEDETEPEESGTKIVNFIVKGDVVGSVEAVCAAVLEIGNNEVRPKVLRAAAGQITESDVDHAATSKSFIINFNNPIPGFIKRRAEDAKVKILDHNVIYHLTDEVKDKLSDQLAPTVSIRVIGEAEVLQVFPINLKARVYKNIAGCKVRNGQITRSSKYRVIRKGEKVFEGSADSLKHGKKDVNEMKKGSECGISFEGWDDIQQGDQIQAYEETQEKRQL